MMCDVDAKDEAEREAWSEALADAFSHAFLRTYLPPTLVHQRGRGHKHTCPVSPSPCTDKCCCVSGRLSRLLQCREEVEVMCLLIRHQPLLTAPLDADLQDLTTRLATKCSRLQHLRYRPPHDTSLSLSIYSPPYELGPLIR
jgi:hypothetical protein